MSALFTHRMALAMPNFGKLREDGTNNWDVHHFNRSGKWVSSNLELCKAEAQKRAKKARRKARKDATRLTIKGK